MRYEGRARGRFKLLMNGLMSVVSLIQSKYLNQFIENMFKMVSFGAGSSYICFVSYYLRSTISLLVGNLLYENT